MRTNRRSSGGWVSSWVVGRGKGPQFAVGAALTGLLALTLCAGGAWTFYTHARASRDGEVRGLSVTATTMTHAAEQMLASGDATGLQHLVSECAIDAGLEGATLSLEGVGVVADKAIGNVVVRDIPGSWGAAGASSPGNETRVANNTITLTRRLQVAGKGDATLTLIRKYTPPMLGDFNAQAGLGGIAAGIAVVGYLVFRSLRSRMRGLGAISEALHQASAFAPGELPAAAMRISDELGDDAIMWNRLITDRDAAVARRDIESAALRQQTPGGSGGDTATAFDALWMGLIVLDAECKVRAINGAAAVFLKHPRQEIVSRDLSAYVSDKSVMDVVEGVVRGRTKQRTVVETMITDESKGSEQTILRMTVRPMRKEDGAAALLVVEDITQQRVADEARNAFVAQATHELRTPLTNIRLYTDAMIEDSDNPEIRTKALNVISSESRRLERIVADMLSVSEIEAGTLKIVRGDVRLDQLFEELKDDYRVQAEDKEIAMVFELPPKLPVVHADRDKYALALHNLIGNALKYTPAGGKVTIRAEELPGKFLVHVIDNGIGIKKEEHELVFDKFYRAKDGRVATLTGTGLGLTLARDVARMHGGNVLLDSEINKGSKFTLEIPLAAEGGGARAAA